MAKLHSKVLLTFSLMFTNDMETLETMAQWILDHENPRQSSLLRQRIHTARIFHANQSIKRLITSCAKDCGKATGIATAVAQ